MKWSQAFVASLWVVLMPRFSAAVTLTMDPLTQLPLVPATISRFNMGNEPTRIKDSTICESKMAGDNYSVYESIDMTIAWYVSHLKGLKHAHGYSNGRSRDTFYNSPGAIMVTVTGDRGSDGEKVDTHGVVYYTFQPGLSEKAILAMLQENIVCS